MDKFLLVVDDDDAAHVVCAPNTEQYVRNMIHFMRTERRDRRPMHIVKIVATNSFKTSCRTREVWE